MFTRYAIYYTPEPGSPLAAFGASWLGWDSAAGQSVDHPVVEGIDLDAVTETPRKYGFHGTIKPPFHMQDGQDLDALEQSLRALCATAAPVTLDGLELARLGRFLALVPRGSATALGSLAARAVQELDQFRAPPSEAELTKRRGAGLNPAQDAHLVRWGYPYVLDQFRFHMTLSGRLDKAMAKATEEVLGSRLAQLTLNPYTISGLTLLGEDRSGRFHQVSRHAFTG